MSFQFLPSPTLLSRPAPPALIFLTPPPRANITLLQFMHFVFCLVRSCLLITHCLFLSPSLLLLLFIQAPPSSDRDPTLDPFFRPPVFFIVKRLFSLFLKMVFEFLCKLQHIKHNHKIWRTIQKFKAQKLIQRNIEEEAKYKDYKSTSQHSLAGSSSASTRSDPKVSVNCMPCVVILTMNEKDG